MLEERKIASAHRQAAAESERRRAAREANQVGTGRKSLPPHLPRIEVIIEPEIDIVSLLRRGDARDRRGEIGTTQACAGGSRVVRAQRLILDERDVEPEPRLRE